jgi:twitching motility protein PilI
MSVAWLAVKAGAHNYLLPLGQAGEIVALSSVQPVPYAKAWFKGVLNIRGSLFGVADLAGFLAASGAVATAPDVAATQASMVTLNTSLEVNCALQVDSLAGLRGSEAFVSNTPATAQAPAYFGSCFVDAEGQGWQEIDLRALAQSAAFLSIGA